MTTTVKPTGPALGVPVCAGCRDPEAAPALRGDRARGPDQLYLVCDRCGARWEIVRANPYALAPIGRGLLVEDLLLLELPFLSPEQREFLLWEETGWPCFWNIPRDGSHPVECLRTQLRRVARSCRPAWRLAPQAVHAHGEAAMTTPNVQRPTVDDAWAEIDSDALEDLAREFDRANRPCPALTIRRAIAYIAALQSGDVEERLRSIANRQAAALRNLTGLPSRLRMEASFDTPDIATLRERMIALADAIDEARIDADRSAARWHALIGSQRIRIIGTARLGQPDAHIGLELWGRHPSVDPDLQAKNADLLTRYVDGLR